MKYKIPSAVLLLALALLPFTGTPIAHAATSLTTCAQLQNIGSLGLNGDYVLANDINCSSIADFQPIGTFTGTLDGQNHIISGFTIDQFLGTNKAMFSSTNGAIIRNITFTGIDVDGYLNTAVIASSATNTIFSNISLSGTFRGDTPSGGIAAVMTNSVIIGSYSNLSMSTWSDAGQLVGRALSGSIISTSHSDGSLVSLGTQVGGLVGVNDSSTIRNSYSATSLVGGNSIAGLVGVNNGSTALIDKSYSVGSVGSIGSTGIGGLVGVQTNSATTTDSYWNTTTSGRGSSAGGTGKNTAQMQTQGTFVGWDFTNVWSISAGQYPALITPDTTPPAQVTGLTGSAGITNTVNLSWTNPGDVDFASITVQRSASSSPSNTFTGTTAISGTVGNSLNDGPLADGIYYYSVFTIDTAGNISIPVRVTVPVDTTPPSPVTSLAASVTGSTVNLTWTNPGTDFGGVGIRRSPSAYPASINDGDLVAAGLVGTSRADSALPDGTYYYSVFVRDILGNYSIAANITATVDTVLPVLVETTAIGATTDTTPNYTFNSTRAGTITYGGSCSSATTVATSGTNTVTFNALAQGTYSNCTIRVTDAFGNISTALSASTFVIDTTPPTIVAGTAVSGTINQFVTVYTFTANEPGVYSVTGCSASVNSNSLTVSFAQLLPGTHTCILSGRDAAGNVSNTITIGPFTVLGRGGVPALQIEAGSGSSGPLGISVLKVESFDGGQKVTFALNASSATVQGYAVSLDPMLRDTGIVPYASTGTIIVPSVAGTYNLYLKYYSTTGVASELITQAVTTRGGSPSRVVTPTLEVKNTSPSSIVLNRNLKTGMSGTDILQLQQFMNAQGFTVTLSGNGAPGKESTYFGPKLKAAVMRYQKTRAIVPASGIVGPLTRASIDRDAATN